MRASGSRWTSRPPQDERGGQSTGLRREELIVLDLEQVEPSGVLFGDVRRCRKLEGVSFEGQRYRAISPAILSARTTPRNTLRTLLCPGPIGLCDRCEDGFPKMRSPCISIQAHYI